MKKRRYATKRKNRRKRDVHAKYRNKLVQYRILRKNGKLKSAMPYTRKYNKRRLSKGIKKHRSLMLKPYYGRLGRGILRVSKTNGRYVVKSEHVYKRFRKIKNAHRFVKRRMKGKKYILQKDIRLAKVNGRKFDIRVMVQRYNRRSPWVVTGMFTRIGYKNEVITNLAWKVSSLKSTLRRSRLNASKKKMNQIKKTCIVGAKQIAKHHKNCKIIGFDIGLNEQGKVWIIEPNFTPGVYPFRMLKRKNMYRKIMRYKNRRR
ncbi:YheC/YheD family protein [Longirhabdus pacifica]|uniref:YheC/YheD family protein n=1 Tax=Longirhabdus pacifica TaxID=2305227 RepID=UPI0013E8CF33|nr:YheC/YheD family protein [Longirhabdus pacifica]